MLGGGGLTMGQHKYNPNCQLAKEGKLPPKPKRMSKREQERQIYAAIFDSFARNFVLAAQREFGERRSE